MKIFMSSIFLSVTFISSVANAFLPEFTGVWQAIDIKCDNSEIKSDVRDDLLTGMIEIKGDKYTTTGTLEGCEAKVQGDLVLLSLKSIKVINETMTLVRGCERATGRTVPAKDEIFEFWFSGDNKFLYLKQIDDADGPDAACAKTHDSVTMKHRYVGPPSLTATTP